MTDYTCPSCGGGFPANALVGAGEDACPWCGESMNEDDDSDDPLGVATPQPLGTGSSRPLLDEGGRLGIDRPGVDPEDILGRTFQSSTPRGRGHHSVGGGGL